jgi:hypothetical protein
MGGIASLFSPKLPKPEPTVRAPDESSPSVLEVRRRKESELRAAKGRQSTILTGTEAPTYINEVLGQ